MVGYNSVAVTVVTQRPLSHCAAALCRMSTYAGVRCEFWDPWLLGLRQTRMNVVQGLHSCSVVHLGIPLAHYSCRTTRAARAALVR